MSLRKRTSSPVWKLGTIVPGLVADRLTNGSQPVWACRSRGSKRHLICDGRGIPLAIRLNGANCHD